MKRYLLLLILGAAFACPSLVKAQDDSTNAAPAGPPSGGHHHDHDMGMGLTDAEKQELKAAHDKAIANDPSLKTDEDALKASHQAGTPPTDDQKAQWMAFRKKMNEAMIAADPDVKPILAKIDAAHHHHHDAGGAAPTPPPADNN